MDEKILEHCKMLNQDFTKFREYIIDFMNSEHI